MPKLDKGLLGQDTPGKFYAVAVLKGAGSTPSINARHQRLRQSLTHLDPVYPR